MPAPSAPPSLTTPPTAPSRNDAPATFISRMNAFLAWIVTFVSEMGTMATALYNYATSAYNDAATANTKAGEATAAASTATTAATTATTQAGIATSAASASAGWKATSTSSLALTSGAKTITIDAGKQFTAGTDIKIKRTSAPTTSYAYTTVSTYNSGTGELTFTLSSDLITGSGTYTDWTVELSGGRGAAGNSAAWRQAKPPQTVSTAVAYVEFTDIPQNASMLALRVSGASHNHSGDAQVRVAWSTGNGSSYFTRGLNTQAASDLLYGEIFLTSYTKDTGLLVAAVEAVAATPGGFGVNNANAAMRHTGGVNALRFSFSSGQVDAGTFSLEVL